MVQARRASNTSGIRPGDLHGHVICELTPTSLRTRARMSDEPNADITNSREGLRLRNAYEGADIRVKEDKTTQTHGGQTEDAIKK